MFQKGQSGNKNGRPKGSPNKTNAQLRTLIANFLEENFEDVQKEFQSLDGKEKVKAFSELLPFALPKLSAVSTNINYDELSDEQLDDLFKKLLQHAN